MSLIKLIAISGIFGKSDTDLEILPPPPPCPSMKLEETKLFIEI